MGRDFGPRETGSEPGVSDGNLKKLRKYKNQNIVATHSKYNYNLQEQGDNLTDYQYIEKRVKALCFKSGWCKLAW